MRLENSSFLAPISDYSNLPFRQMCLGAGADFAEVPLVSVIAIRHSPSSVERIDLSESERGRTGIQLFGKEPADFGNAIGAISEKFPFNGWFDVNCGCPTNNVIASGGGAALLKSPERIAEIIKACRARCRTVSAKVRILGSADRTLEICRAVEKSGADFITVHGRTPEQGYAGKADWEMIKRIKEELSIPVIGNGDIASVVQGRRLVNEGYCDGFMVCRGAMSNPYLFKGEETGGFGAKKAMLLDYIRRCRELGGPDVSDIRMKALFFLRGFPESAEMRNAISRLKKTDEITGLLESY
jgi:nifR3 family TIM-barrel protein